jgi:hypothetical protein
MEQEQEKPADKTVQVGWECRECLDVFTKPKMVYDYDYEQMAPTCPLCGVYL